MENHVRHIFHVQLIYTTFAYLRFNTKKKQKVLKQNLQKQKVNRMLLPDGNVVCPASITKTATFQSKTCQGFQAAISISFCLKPRS